MNDTLYVGIDPGVKTGLATWNPRTRTLTAVTSNMPLAFCEIIRLSSINDLHIIVEDARQRTWYGQGGIEKLQGAGAIKVQCTIWQQFLEENGISHQFLPPLKGMTKLGSESFNKITGYEGRTSNHARDAAMLIYGRK
jgi:hypothetical protein